MTARRISLMLGALLLAGVAGATFAQSSAAPGNGDSMARNMKNDGNNDAMFMRHAAADNLAEIQAGRLALDKGTSAQVKQLAQRIVDDHTKANDQLMSIAQRKQVSLPTEPMPEQKQEAAQLRSLSGSAFDQAYAQAMVKDHRKAIKMFGMESQTGSDPGVKQFARTTLPVLKQHLQMAEQAAGGHGMSRADGTPMDSNGSMNMPASGSSTH